AAFPVRPRAPAAAAGSVACSISSTRRLSSPYSDTPWQRATLTKRCFVSFFSQVLSCLPSLIVSDICTREQPSGFAAFHSKCSETAPASYYPPAFSYRCVARDRAISGQQRPSRVVSQISAKRPEDDTVSGVIS